MIQIKVIKFGVAEKSKARFEAKRFGQKEGVEFGEAFSPTIGLETFNLVLVIAAQHILHLEQLEEKSAFLKAKTNEQVILKQSESLAIIAKDGIKPVCNINISMYTLKQDSKNWYNRLKTFLLGFLQQVSCKIKAILIFMLNVKSLAWNKSQYG